MVEMEPLKQPAAKIGSENVSIVSHQQFNPSLDDIEADYAFLSHDDIKYVNLKVDAARAALNQDSSCDEDEEEEKKESQQQPHVAY